MRYILIKYFSLFISKRKPYIRRKISGVLSFLFVRFFAFYLKKNLYINYIYLYPYFDKQRKKKYFKWKIYAKEVVKHYIYEQMEIMRILYMKEEEIKKVSVSMGLYKYKNIMEDGCIIVIPHQSGWEMAGIAIGYVFKGKSMALVESGGIDEKTYKLYEKIRGLTGMKILPVETAGKKILHHIKNRGILILLGDRDITRTGWKTKIFGEYAKIPNGPISISSLLGVPIIVGSLRRREDNLIASHIVGVINKKYEKKEIRETGINEYIYFLEKAILKNPEEWFVFYPIWEV